MNQNFKIYHDDHFSLWTGNQGRIVGVGSSEDTKRPMPYNLDNGMFAIAAQLIRPIETAEWHIIVLHSNTWVEAGDKVIRKHGGINLVRIQGNVKPQMIFPSEGTA
jgi:hypothetical protein